MRVSGVERSKFGRQASAIAVVSSFVLTSCGVSEAKNIATPTPRSESTPVHKCRLYPAMLTPDQEISVAHHAAPSGFVKVFEQADIQDIEFGISPKSTADEMHRADSAVTAIRSLAGITIKYHTSTSPGIIEGNLGVIVFAGDCLPRELPSEKSTPAPST